MCSHKSQFEPLWITENVPVSFPDSSSNFSIFCFIYGKQTFSKCSSLPWSPLEGCRKEISDLAVAKAFSTSYFLTALKIAFSIAPLLIIAVFLFRGLLKISWSKFVRLTTYQIVLQNRFVGPFQGTYISFSFHCCCSFWIVSTFFLKKDTTLTSVRTFWRQFFFRSWHRIFFFFL